MQKTQLVSTLANRQNNTIDPARIVKQIKGGPRNGVHDTESIEKQIVAKCDPLQLATYIDDETALNIPSLCQLILPNVSTNINQMYCEGLFDMLQSCEIFSTMNVTDGILRIISEYIQQCVFAYEYPEDQKPRSAYNSGYYCDIKKVTLSPHMISIFIEEYGDYTFGSIQAPYHSTLATTIVPSYASLEEKRELKYTSLSRYNLKKEVYGVLTYRWSNLYAQTSKLIREIKFSYGSSGYGFAALFNAKNEHHQAFIEAFLNYHKLLQDKQ